MSFRRINSDNLRRMDLKEELSGKSSLERQIGNFKVKYDDALKNLNNLNNISLKSLETKLAEEEEKYDKMMKPCHSKNRVTRTEAKMVYSYNLSKTNRYIDMLKSLIVLKKELRGIRVERKINEKINAYLLSDDTYFTDELANLESYLR